MKKKTINEVWEDDTGLLFPLDNRVRNRAPWFSWLPEVFFLHMSHLSCNAWRLWALLNHMAKTNSTVEFTMNGLAKYMGCVRNTILKSVRELEKHKMLVTTKSLKADQRWTPLTFNVQPGRILLRNMQDQITARNENRSTDRSWKETEENSKAAQEELEEMFGEARFDDDGDPAAKA